jgi:hypothetical protein
MLLVQTVLECHDAQTHRTVTQVGVAGFFDSVIVDVDHIVEHAHRGVDGFLELVVVQFLALGPCLR